MSRVIRDVAVDFAIRDAAIVALGRIGPAAEGAAPALRGIIERSSDGSDARDRFTLQKAQAALEKIRAPAATPPVSP